MREEPREEGERRELLSSSSLRIPPGFFTTKTRVPLDEMLF